MSLRHLLVTTLFGIAGVQAWAADALPNQQEFEPPEGQGRVVIVISGQTGPAHYAHVAKDLAAKGYDAVLVDGNDMFGMSIPGEQRLRAVIEHAHQSPHATPAKAAVVGFSLGGGAAITYGPRMPDLVSATVVAYPFTRHVLDPKGFVGKMQGPLLLMAGTQDTYRACCVIERARQIADEAKAAGKDVQLIEYPAGHGWNLLGTREYDAKVATDSLQHTLDFLQAPP